jgi:hypothetical protein
MKYDRLKIEKRAKLCGDLLSKVMPHPLKLLIHGGDRCIKAFDLRRDLLWGK